MTLPEVCALSRTGQSVHASSPRVEITPGRKTVTIYHSAAGARKIVVRSRDQVKTPITYSIHEALLAPATIPTEATDTTHPSGATWTLQLPASTPTPNTQPSESPARPASKARRTASSSR